MPPTPPSIMPAKVAPLSNSYVLLPLPPIISCMLATLLRVSPLGSVTEDGAVRVEGEGEVGRYVRKVEGVHAARACISDRVVTPAIGEYEPVIPARARQGLVVGRGHVIGKEIVVSGDGSGAEEGRSRYRRPSSTRGSSRAIGAAPQFVRGSCDNRAGGRRKVVDEPDTRRAARHIARVKQDIGARRKRCLPPGDLRQPALERLVGESVVPRVTSPAEPWERM